MECETAAKTLSESVAVTLSVEGVNVRLSLLQQGLCLDPGTHISRVLREIRSGTNFLTSIVDYCSTCTWYFDKFITISNP